MTPSCDYRYTGESAINLKPNEIEHSYYVAKYIFQSYGIR